MHPPKQTGRERWVGRLVLGMERWLPDAFVFALLATVMVMVAAVWRRDAGLSVTLSRVLLGWGRGFFSLLAFTLQMALVVILGHVVASAPASDRLLLRLAMWPKTGRGAVVFVTLWALGTAWLNWGFSLISSALLAKRVARAFAARGQPVDYRALSAASFLGLGSIWAQGLSGSAALQMATGASMPAALQQIVACGRPGCVAIPGTPAVIPLSQTIFLWQSFASVAVEIFVVTGVMWAITPRAAHAVTAAQLHLTLDEPNAPDPGPAAASGSPSLWTWLEQSRVLSGLLLLLGLSALVCLFVSDGGGLAAINVNTVLLGLLLLGVALHGTPARLQRAFAVATPATWGVLLQFPFYGGIAGMLSATHLNEALAHVFVQASTAKTLPPLVAAYSAILGIFVPSGGGKWLIEAPYVLSAAHAHHVHLGFMVAVYDLGEALANLLQPFWMLPVLSVLGLSARQVMGYTLLVFCALFPTVLLLTYWLGQTL